MASHEGETAALPPLPMEEKPTMYFEGFPGCAVDSAKAKRTGIPYALFFHVWIITLVSCLPISTLYPYLYFMIRDLNVAKRVEDIGFYAGFVGASYMFGRALTSSFWGMLADRIGRRPVIVIGIFTGLVFNTLFGLSVHYWMAIATRFLLGSFNGLLGPIRAYVVEVCRHEHQTIGLSVVSTAWAMALIIGPAIGGYLAQPTEKYPKWFPSNSLFDRFPYFLPCFCISAFYFAILISCIWLPETLHTHKYGSMEDQLNEPLIEHLDDSEQFVEPQNISSTNKSLYKNWPLMSSIILFCIVSFEDMAYSELFPLWAESDRSLGGLSFSSTDVSQVLALTGGTIIVYQTFTNPHIMKVMGLLNTSRIVAILSMVVLSTYPYMTLVSGHWLSIVLNVASMIKANCVVTIVTCSFILQNNSVSQVQRATANGIATTLMSFSQAIAPTGSGIVLSWAQKHQHDFFIPGLYLMQQGRGDSGRGERRSTSGRGDPLPEQLLVMFISPYNFLSYKLCSMMNSNWVRK